MNTQTVNVSKPHPRSSTIFLRYINIALPRVKCLERFK